MNGAWGYIIGSVVTGAFLLASQLVSAHAIRKSERFQEQRESRAREEAARISGVERVRDFEHEVVAELQTALFEHIRAIQHVLDFDVKQLASGSLTMLPEGLSQSENETRLRCFFLSHRILDDNLRTSLGNFLSETAQVLSDALNAKIDTQERALALRSSLLQSSLTLGDEYASLQHQLGDELRKQLLGEYGQLRRNF